MISQCKLYDQYFFRQSIDELRSTDFPAMLLFDDTEGIPLTIALLPSGKLTVCY